MLPARRWLALWQRFGVARHADDVLAEAFRELTTRYAEPHRHYHTAGHIADCLTQFDAVHAQCEHGEEVELALWFHDAIYNPRAKDNEQQSAQWAVRVLNAAGAQPIIAERIHALIMATRHDAVPENQDARILVDIDLSILGAEENRFDAYEQQVRAEHAWVPDFLFRRTRRKILEGFLAWPAIYATDGFRQRLERNARANLARSLRKLDNR